MATVKKTQSSRVRVRVSRKFGDGQDVNKIFVGCRVEENGVTKMQQFRVPVDVAVNLPPEVIECLKERGVPKEKNGTLQIAKEFSVEKVD